ncbi:MAG: DNA polymerase IV [Pirellulales bacterium]|nr:DNA polymerase IV [Pirellulales bacterium]
MNSVRQRDVLHVDMDAFYASVEERDRPELQGKPVIVAGGADQRGVVSAANYVARKFGVHSAMPTATALRLCPHAVRISPRHDHYAGVSRKIREIFLRFTPLIEPLALDEAFLDVTGSRRIFGDAEKIGRQIKQTIRDETQLVASVGVAPNKFLAKVASDVRKPDGFVVVARGEEQAFLGPLPVSRLWGMGPAGQKVMERHGIHTIAQLRDYPEAALAAILGPREAAHLRALSLGVDHRAVTPDAEAKSISHETTFAVDIADRDVLRNWLLELTIQVARRLRRYDLRGRTVGLKVRFADFRTITRSHSLAQPTNTTQEIWLAAAEILSTRVPTDRGAVRLIGIGVSHFDNASVRQTMLFEEHTHEKETRLDATVDEIADRFGNRSIKRGATLRKREGK